MRKDVLKLAAEQYHVNLEMPGNRNFVKDF